MGIRHQDVVILGGGYAGQMAAARLAQKGLPLRVTLVDRSPHFVERIRLHQVAAGAALPRHEMAAMLAPIGVTFRQGQVLGFDPANRTVTLAGVGAQRGTLHYDWLIYAFGSHTERWAVPGVAEHALTLEAPAPQMQGQMAALQARGGRLLVVGGGLTAIEVATEVAERFPAIRVVVASQGALGAGLSPAGQAALDRAFQRRNIARREGVRVVAVEADRAVLADGGSIPFELCLWTAGLVAPTLAAEAGLAVNGRGQVLTDMALRVPGHPEIIAAGDAAAMVNHVGGAIRMACASAMPAGVHAAETIAAQMGGATAVAPFRFGFTGQCISFGRHDGLIQFVNADDSPRPTVLTGRVAAWVKEGICRMTVLAPAAERRLRRPIYQWPQPTLATNHHPRRVGAD